MAKKLKCECCGEPYTIEESKDYFWRELALSGNDDDFEEYFEDDMCGSCNYEQWWDHYERKLKSDPGAATAFHNTWSWVTDDD